MLMYLNGEGTKVNLDKAQAVLDEEIAKYEEQKEWRLDATLAEFKKIISERRSAPAKEYKRLDYGDIAMTTFDMNYYAAIQNRLQEQRAHQELEALKKGLESAEKERLDEVEKWAKEIVESGGKRIYLDYIHASIGNLAAQGYESYLMNRHQDRIAKWIGKGQLPSPGPGGLDRSDADLNAQYGKMREDGKSRLEEMRSEKDGAVEFFEKYPDTLKNEQRAWIQYRDAWVALLKLHPPEGYTNRLALETAVRDVLTRARVEELKYDPIASDE